MSTSEAKIYFERGKNLAVAPLPCLLLSKNFWLCDDCRARVSGVPTNNRRGITADVYARGGDNCKYRYVLHFRHERYIYIFYHVFKSVSIVTVLNFLTDMCCVSNDFIVMSILFYSNKFLHTIRLIIASDRI